MARTGLIRDNAYLEHITSDFHPEHPDRLRAIYSILEDQELQGKTAVLEAPEATAEEIRRIHTESYYQKIESTRDCGHRRLDPDTHVSSQSYRAAKLAAGGLCVLVDAVCSGEIGNGFALVPPARPSCGSGQRDGLLHLQQHRHRGTVCSEQGTRRKGSDRGLGPASRKRNPALLRIGSLGPLLLLPPVPLLPRHRKAG